MTARIDGAGHQPSTRPTDRDGRTRVLRVVGLTFGGDYPGWLEREADAHHGSGRWADCRITRQPDNPHDPNAIQVRVRGYGGVGHLSAKDAAVLAPLLDSGTSFDVSIEKISGVGTDHPGLRIRITETPNTTEGKTP